MSRIKKNTNLYYDDYETNDYDDDGEDIKLSEIYDHDGNPIKDYDEDDYIERILEEADRRDANDEVRGAILDKSRY